ncbi:MAG: outer membrane beta-barrel protein [Bacteroidales bacterium]|nr:outer membrane beta-barrel protein [Bacteroidales bacterium]
MRKYLLFVLLMFVVFISQAQPQPGRYILRGSSDISGLFLSTNYRMGSNTTQVDRTQINFQPSVGGFITHYIFLGMYTGYEYQKEMESGGYNKSNEFLIGPYVRGYIGDYKFIPFFQMKVGYSNYKLEQKDIDSGAITNISMDGVDYGFGIGIEYFFERKFTLELLLSYDGTKVDNNEYSTNNLGVSTSEICINERGFGFKVGASVFLK